MSEKYVLDGSTVIPLRETHGCYTIEFTVDSFDTDGGCSLGVMLDSENGGRAMNFCMIRERLLLLCDGVNGRALLRAFPLLYGDRPNSFRIDVYPPMKLIRYWVNGCFYGERRLAHPFAPPLPNGVAALFSSGAVRAVISGVRVYEAAPPVNDYIVRGDIGAAVGFERLFPRSSAPDRTIYFIDASKLTREDYVTALTLQGLVNRASPRLYVHSGRYNDRNSEPLTHRYKLLEAKGYSLVPCTVDEALTRFSGDYSGIVTGDISSSGETSFELNLVTMLSGVQNRVYFSRERAEKLVSDVDRSDIDCFNIDGRFSSDLEAYRWALDNLWRDCAHGIICHMYGDDALHFTEPSRDYLVEYKIFVFSSSQVKTEEDYYFYLRLLDLTPPSTPVIGIASRNGEARHTAVFDEDALFAACAELGKFFVYTFSVDNMSVFSGIPETKLRQKPYPPVKPDPGKAYAAFMLSEGENYAWAYHLWDGCYRDTSRASVAKGWGVAGAMYFLAPSVLRDYYDSASDNDAWYLDGNGIGDMYNPDTFGLRLTAPAREAALSAYLSLTAALMDASDLHVIRLFDAVYSVTDDAIRRYIRDIPGIKAIFTGYNSEPDASRFPARSYFIDGVPVFRTRVTCISPAYKPGEDGQVLLDGINRELSSGRRPDFINVFVLGNYMLKSGSATLGYVKDRLPSGCELVRPDQLADIMSELSGDAQPRE